VQRQYLQLRDRVFGSGLFGDLPRGPDLLGPWHLHQRDLRLRAWVHRDQLLGQLRQRIHLPDWDGM
jgi:hypothetical protein